MATVLFFCGINITFITILSDKWAWEGSEPDCHPSACEPAGRFKKTSKSHGPVKQKKKKPKKKKSKK